MLLALLLHQLRIRRGTHTNIFHLYQSPSIVQPQRTQHTTFPECYKIGFYILLSFHPPAACRLSHGIPQSHSISFILFYSCEHCIIAMHVCMCAVLYMDDQNDWKKRTYSDSILFSLPFCRPSCQRFISHILWWACGKCEYPVCACVEHVFCIVCGKHSDRYQFAHWVFCILVSNRLNACHHILI